MTLLYRDYWGKLHMRFLLPSVATGLLGRAFRNGDVVMLDEDGPRFVARGSMVM